MSRRSSWRMSTTILAIEKIWTGSMPSRRASSSYGHTKPWCSLGSSEAAIRGAAHSLSEKPLEASDRTHPARVIPHPYRTDPAGQAAAVGVGAPVLVSLPAPPAPPAQTAVSTCRYLDTYFCTFFLSHSQQYQWETCTQNMREFLSRYLDCDMADLRVWCMPVGDRMRFW